MRTIPFEALFLGQCLGTVVLLVGLSMGGLTTLTAVGGAIIGLSVAGLALEAFASEQELHEVEETATSGETVHQ